MSQTFDFILIGAGHNGMTCAAYLAKAGYSCLVLERRGKIGGCATTEEAMPEEAPGFRFNLCAIDHEFIHLGPVLRELKLEHYGLEYLWCDPTVFCPHPDGSFFLAWQDVERTCKEIERFSPRDAVAYRDFISYWQRAMRLFATTFNAAPQSIPGILRNFNPTVINDLFDLADGPTGVLEFARRMVTSPQNLINEWFDAEFIKAPIARLAAELGAPPSEKGIAFGVTMLAMRHGPGMSRPRGGTGMLTQALGALLTDLGVEILTDAPVGRILVDNTGRAVGVRTQAGQEYQCKMGVISNLDAVQLFNKLLDPADAEAWAEGVTGRLNRTVVNNNESVMKIDCALSEPPRFSAWGHQDDWLIGSLLIADSVEHVERAHQEPLQGKIPDDPSLYVVVPTVLDPSMAPPGKHTLWIEFFAPWEITQGPDRDWGLIKEKIADRCIDKLAQYCPNLKSSIIARRVESPVELAARTATLKGNFYHMDMTVEQMLFFRPLPELANYKTSITGLYLTGAGTHPGGSISGMPGRNCAHAILREYRSFSRPRIVRKVSKRVKNFAMQAAFRAGVDVKNL
jgi:beta-carotene ketolase (CrtO type)